MSKYENNNVGLTAWAIDAYKNLTVAAMSMPDHQAREIIEQFLADAPEFFEPTARKYANQRIADGVRQTRGMFNL